MQCSAAAEAPDEEKLLRTHGLLGFRDFCAKKGSASLRQLDKLALAGLAREYVDSSRARQGPLHSARSLRRFQVGLNNYLRSLYGGDFDLGRDPAFAPLAAPSASGAANAGGASRMGQAADAVVITAEDLTKIGQYFWRVINTPRGLQQKVWFDLMIHLGSDGIENQHAMRKDSFALLKSPADGRRRLQWKIAGGASVPDDPENPLCPVRTFQLYLSKLNVACPALFQRPHDGITKTSRFWFHMFPLNNTMLALMMYDISKDAGLSRVYPNFCTQVLPEKGRFYELARRSRPSLESARKEPGCAYKLCAQCLTPVQVASAGPKGILCSVPCLEAFMRAKEARQNVRVSFRDGTRVPAYTLPSGQPLQAQPQPQPRDELGKNLPEDVYSFIQEVARIQALGHTVRTDGLPMVFKQDGSNTQARSLPIELLRIAMDVGKPTKPGNVQQQQPQQQPQRVEIIKRVPATTGERVSARPVMLSGGRKVLLVQRRDPPPPAPQRGSAAWR
ncbi:uncharacterized protein [Dermacentor albipictus]|uniref:uncharacterized protein n=1 Tax=Dermacentor albipictus TaxID=60249 RepID=UPI0038FCFD5C